jgi:uncharacterized membrane protein
MQTRHPLHPAFAHFPVALWAVSFICDMVALGLDDLFWWRAGFWSLTAGLLVALPAATTGFLEYMTIKPGDTAIRTANFHMIAMSTATSLFLVSCLVRSGGMEAPTGMMLVIALGCSVLGFGALAAGVWFATDLVYRYGVGARRLEQEEK